MVLDESLASKPGRRLAWKVNGLEDLSEQAQNLTTFSEVKFVGKKVPALKNIVDPRFSRFTSSWDHSQNNAFEGTIFISFFNLGALCNVSCTFLPKLWKIYRQFKIR